MSVFPFFSLAVICYSIGAMSVFPFFQLREVGTVVEKNGIRQRNVDLLVRFKERVLLEYSYLNRVPLILSHLAVLLRTHRRETRVY